MTSAVIYVRVSTAKQAENELPIESQVERCREKAKELGAVVDKVFRDEGISGYTDSRPAFQDAIEYSELTTPDYFITWSTSRFARNKVDAGLYKMRLERANVNLVYVSQNIDRKTDTGWITESIFELFDEFYSRQVSADTTRSMMKNARDGYWNGGCVVYGYTTAVAADNPKRKCLVINPGEADLVREVFQFRIHGYGAKAIADILNDRGDKNRGKAWNRTSIGSLLRNEAVIGCVVFGKRNRKTKTSRPRDQWIVVPSHPPIISEEDWAKVQEIMDSATPDSGSGSPHSTRYFTGILRCQDGSSMQIKSGKGRTKRYYYYDCNNAKKYGGRSRPIRADLLDEWLVDQVLSQILTPENLRGALRDIQVATSTWESDRRKRLNSVQKSLNTLLERNSNIYDIFELHGKDSPNLSDLTSRLRQNKKKIEDLERQLLDINAEKVPDIDLLDQDVTELADSLSYIIKTSEDPKKVRSFFRSFIKDIWVEDSNIKIEYHPELLVANKQPIVVPSTQDWRPVPVLLGTRELVIDLPMRFHRKAA